MLKSKILAVAYFDKVKAAKTCADWINTLHFITVQT